MSGGQRDYRKSSSRTPNASASLRVVRSLAIKRSSSKSEIESAETPFSAGVWLYYFLTWPAWARALSALAGFEGPA